MSNLNSNLPTQDTSDGSVTPGTAATNSILIGGQFNSTLPTLTTTQQSAAQLDSSGRLIISSVFLRDTTTSSITNTIKAASIAPTTTDTAIVVAISPNTPAIKEIIVDPITGVGASVSTTGQLNVGIAPTEVFNESFEGGVIDTINRWNSPVLAGTATVTQSSTLGLVISVGTTANNAGALNSMPTFPTAYGSTTTIGWAASIESTTIATGNYRFMGVSTQGTTYSVTDPIKDGIGFEITTSGVLRAVIYASDVLQFSTVLTIPTDGAEHAYFFTTTGNLIQWFIDNSIPKATATFQAPNITLLPLRFSSLNGTSTTTGTPLLTIFDAAVLDSGRNSTQLSDGIYPWRRATVSATGNLSVIQVDKSGSGTLPALNSTVISTLNAYSTIVFDVTGTWVGTILFQAQNGDGTWNNILGTVTGQGIAAAALTSNGSIAFPCGGFTQVRAIMSAYTSGTANIQYNASIGEQSIQVFNLQPTSLVGIMNIKDSSGNSVAAINSQLETRDVINVSSQYRAQSITTSAAEALGGATILANRKLITITPTNGIIYWGTNSSVTTTTGTPIFTNQTLSLIFTDNIHIFLIAAATTDCRIVEAS